MMYESPIEIIYNEMRYKINEKLVKALNYDRQQYEKGYRDAEPKKGKWTDLGGVIRWGCPHCHYAQEVRYNFCPNCGADMRGEEGEDE